MSDDDTPTPSPSHDDGRPANGGRSHPWMGWTLGLLAVPVVYVLTLPPIFFLAMPHGFSPGASWRTPRWLVFYAYPYVWAADHTPPGHLLNKYGAWWRSVLE